MNERTLLFVAAASALVSATASGCGSNSSGKSAIGGTPGDAGGALGADSGGGSVHDSGNVADVTRTNDGPSSIGDTGVGRDAPSDASLTCAPPVDGDSCDACTAANCCAQLRACTGEPMDPDADTTPCEDIANCMDACENPADGSAPPSDCLGLCTQPYGSDQAVTDYNDLSSCQQTLCPTDC